MSAKKGTKDVRSAELIHHFRCRACGRWWSIGDAPKTKTTWFCPWCGMKDSYMIEARAK